MKASCLRPPRRGVCPFLQPALWAGVLVVDTIVAALSTQALSVEDVAQAVGMDMVRDREVAQAATSCAQGQGLDDVERFLLSHAA